MNEELARLALESRLMSRDEVNRHITYIKVMNRGGWNESYARMYLDLL
jgi:hypothetical protein